MANFPCLLFPYDPGADGGLAAVLTGASCDFVTSATRFQFLPVSQDRASVYPDILCDLLVAHLLAVGVLQRGLYRCAKLTGELPQSFQARNDSS